MTVLRHLTEADRIDIDGGVSSLTSRMGSAESTVAALEANMASLSSALSGKAALSHTHAASDITGSGTVGRSILAAVTKADALSAIMVTQAHIADAATNAPDNAAANAPTDAPTNLNVLTTLVGTLTGEVNATNQRQNTIAAIVNANAAKQNTIATILRDVAAKLNLTFDGLEANKVLAA